MSGDQTPILQLLNVESSYGPIKAIRGVSLQVNAGEIVTVLGSNGAGKSTILKTISGIIEPRKGSVLHQGQDITGMQPFDICYLGLVRTFQIVQPFAGLTVRENIAVGAHLRERNRTAALDKASALATKIGMQDMLDKPAQSLTIAGRKRLELAKALATEPRLLLLDEVMAGLIPTEVSEMTEVIRTIRDSGVEILLIEHLMQAVMSLSDHIYVLNNGRMIANGTPQEITANPLVIEAYLGHGAADA